MEVYQSENIFKSARITGPTSTFLGVEFHNANEPPSILYYETKEPVVNKSAIENIEKAYNCLSSTLEVSNKHHVKAFYISKHDSVDLIAYEALMRSIFSYANENLI